MSGGKALLLVGSPKPRSTSHSLGAYLLARLEERGADVEDMRLVAELRTPHGRQDLLAEVDAADLVILSFPLYVDCLPALAIEALEVVARHRLESPPARRQRFVAICQCGFPEAAHNETALAICRRFAEKTGFEWAGGLAMGAGEAVDDRPLEHAGGMVRGVRRALEMAAEDLSEGRPIRVEAAALMARPLMPTWLYTFLGNLGWRREARRRGAGPLDARPHQDP